MLFIEPEDTRELTTLEVVAATLIGEFENMGEKGMTECASVIANRKAANIHWMGGNNVRTICLWPKQFSCWNVGNNPDRERILHIAKENPTYGPYLIAARIAGDLLNDRVQDCVSGAVSYVNHHVIIPVWAEGKIPVYINEPIWFYSLEQVS